MICGFGLRVKRALRSNVLHLNTLDYSRWNEITKQEDWNDTYNEGFKKLKKLQPKGSNDYSQFQFDLVMANPPFAGDIKENTIISRYELGKNSAGKWQNKVGRDILFIERNLNFLKPGGRMAIVLPQGRFNNSSDKAIREYIAERCRILAVVGLHGNVFKPHTGTKTSVLFVQKWDDELCPKKEDYPIFFATMQKPSKDNSGDKKYLVDPETGLPALLHLKVRDKTEVLPDYLTLVLNSPVVQLQAERDSNGAIIQHWKPSEIENVIIPILGMDTQKEIAAKVQEAFTLRKQSKQLLEYAKQAVEMAIEQGEDVALAWLKDKIPVEV